jgi:hypothetical protein
MDPISWRPFCKCLAHMKQLIMVGFSYNMNLHTCSRNFKCDWSLMPSENFASCHSSNKIVEFLNNLSCVGQSVNQKVE